MRRVLWLVLALVFTAPAAADVKPHGLFTDHMVLQQGAKVPVWGKADPGEKVTVKFQNQTVSGAAGDTGKWMVHLENLKPGGPFEMQIAGKNEVTLKDILVGEVWVCSGQSNMEWSVRACKDPEKTIADAKNSNIRFFHHKKVTSVTPLEDVQTDRQWNTWRVCSPESVPNFSAVAYNFGKSLQEARKVPVGLIHVSWGGTPAEAWTSKEFLEKTPEVAYYLSMWQDRIDTWNKTKDQTQSTYQEELKKYQQAAAKAKEDKTKAPRRPTAPSDPAKNAWNAGGLFNGMINPLLPYAIKGAIWYQGESNAGKAHEYRTLFPAMIQSWRAAWGYDFPFLFVQLAPHKKIVDHPGQSSWAELREAQFLTSQKLAHTAQAVITDTTDEATDQADIHPKNKAPVGERLALAAREKVYGEKIVGTGPVYESVKFDGSKAILSFTSIGGGLMVKGEKLTGFTIAGKDQKFVNAEATLEGNTVVVSSPEVKEPVAIRFGWADYPVVNLFNKEGLPATPFRTDDWPGVTTPKTR
jgi:sialate O-acetylesterase